MGAPRVLLFDIDATLLKSGHAGLRALDRTFEALYGVTKATEGLRPDGKTDPLIFREMLGRTRPDLEAEAELSRVGELYVRHLREEVRHSPGFHLMPGVEALLEALSRMPSVRLGVATGNLEEGARIKLGRAGLDHYFAFGGYGSDAEDRSELIRAAIRRAEAYLGGPVEREQVFVIGDTPRDVRHGQAVGARTVAVATGNSGVEELANCGPDHLFEDFTRTAEVTRVFEERDASG